MRKIGVGVVGCGDIAIREYFPVIDSVKDKIELLGVCDISKERAKLAMQEFKARDYYLDYQDMFEKADIEVVVNLTNAAYHNRINLAALEKGKHLYTEKPMCNEVEKASILIEKAKKYNLKLASAPAVVLNPVVQQVKRIIDKGTIGKVCFSRLRGSCHGVANWVGYCSDPSWFYKKGAGPLFDAAIYLLHTITGILGPAEKVTAFSGISIPEVIVKGGRYKGKRIKVEMDDNTLLLLKFQDTDFACLDATFCAIATKDLPQYEVYGSQGTIYFGGSPLELYTKKEKELGFEGWARPLPTSAKEWRVSDGIEHFIDCIIEDKEPLISAEHARHVIEIIVKAYQAAKEGKTQDLKTSFTLANEIED